jgi:hypothetical protein
VPIFGYSQHDIDAAYARGRKRGNREGKREASDKYGHDANRVWWKWCYSELMAGNRPPMMCPPEIVDQVREKIRRDRPGV